jgi:predicted KAP-like P-loop ATPase
MWSDNETTDDLFGFRVHADLIRELILDPTVLPATIGVYGDWGGGKSSIMQMLKADFDKEPEAGQPDSGVAVLYFNGWLFEGYDEAKAALLSSILTSLKDHKRFGPKIKDEIIKLLKSVDYMRGAKTVFGGAMAAGFAALTGGAGLVLPAIALSAIKGAGEAAPDAIKEGLKKETTGPDDALTDIRKFRDKFAEMLGKSDIKTLVILIDDLDRCSPERIIDNLEAIKLFLNVPNTAFVIGADRRIIRQAVMWRYREALTAAENHADSSERLVEDYLEKLIQIPYRLPRLSPPEIETYLALLFCKRHLDPPGYERICGIARAFHHADRHRAFSQAEVMDALKDTTYPPELSEALRIGAAIASQITDVLMGNPRQVKRFLNAYFLRRKLAHVAKLDDVKDDLLVKLMLLEYRSPTLFDKLFAGMDGQTGIVKFLGELEAKPDAAGARPELPKELADWAPARSWLDMAPALADADLRDYMWVTRDRLGSTMSGTTMLPPAVKNALKLLFSDLGDRQGRGEIPKLQLGERDILAHQLVSRIQRAPQEMKGFQALISLVETDPHRADIFKALIDQIPPRDLPPALAVNIRTLAKQTTPLGKVCAGIVAAKHDGKTPFEKAIKQS